MIKKNICLFMVDVVLNEKHTPDLMAGSVFNEVSLTSHFLENLLFKDE